ncbi:MAG TPA: hypothetical protein VFO73_08765 [Candidatus Limnocylindrales bacterium]|nr:hypothetical protein [Candidatus Limnocylindrales bacterium]
MTRSFLLALVVLLAILAGCAGADGSPPSEPLPSPVCGGIKIKIEGALPCDRVVEIAIDALRDRTPDQLDRGVAAIEVFLTTCPRGEVPPQIDCGTEEFVQLVTVTFRDRQAGGLLEPSLTVAVAPVSGRVLGISNPLIR